MKNEEHKIIACRLSTPELQQRKAGIIAQLKTLCLQRTERENGFSFCFDSKDETIDLLAEFIKSEKQCCPFFEFVLRVQETESWLEISGPEGAKEFITNEMEM